MPASRLGYILMDSCCTRVGTSPRGIGNICFISISKAVLPRIPIPKACGVTSVIDQLGNEKIYSSCTGSRSIIDFLSRNVVVVIAHHHEGYRKRCSANDFDNMRIAIFARGAICFILTIQA